MDYGVLMTDENGVLIFYNEVQSKIDEMDPCDVIGRKITDVYKYNNDSSTCMRVLKHGHPIINYALSYQSKNCNVGNTIHSVFPLFKNSRVVATICFVKDYNILERSIPSFLLPNNNQIFADGTRFTFASIIGSAPAFVAALKQARIAANSPSPVMLYGETGTGKELFAQAIHNFYYGKKKQYIDVNCAAIPDTLIEGILFGTTKGAYTGSVDRVGLFEKANGGTLFLDEINSMSLLLQGKLLRVIQEKKVRPLGSLSSIDLNIKVICSMNADPRDLVSKGLFRMDLFYRLAVIYISIPPLRERLEDVEELGRHFLQKYSRRMEKEISNISPDVIAFFWKYSWPGNIRELEHIIESAVNSVPKNEKTLELRHCYFANLLGLSEPAQPGNLQDQIFDQIGADTLSFLSSPKGPDLFSPVSVTPAGSLSETTLTLEKTRILETLEMTMGNIAMAARRLGMSRQLLGYKLQKLKLRSALAAIKKKNPEN
jgi:arginine utilization regulatory protein